MVNVTNLKIDDLKLDQSKRIIDFVEKENGIFVRPFHIVQWGLSFEYSVLLWGNNYLRGPYSYKFDNFQFECGIRLASTERGAPEFGIYGFNLDEGDSKLDLGDNFLLKAIADVFNWGFKPTALLADIALQPTWDFLANDIISPIFFHSGEAIIPADIVGLGKLEYDIDFGLPYSPKVTKDAIQIYLDGGISVLNEESYA